jgi:hypothetical protein
MSLPKLSEIDSFSASQIEHMDMPINSNEKSANVKSQCIPIM